MKSIVTTVKKLLDICPPNIAGVLEFYLKYNVGGAPPVYFNGQQHRCRIFTEMSRKLGFIAIVETGSFRGSTTEYFAKLMDIPIYSVECNPRNFYHSYARLRKYSHVHLALDDSVEFIKALAHNVNVPKDRVFFYLDAHWYDYLPLYDELKTISEEWTNYSIMIDDFEVPDDAGYGFDAYGKGRKIGIDYIENFLSKEMNAFFPVAPSIAETGAKRGCAVLVPRNMVDEMHDIGTLRLYDASCSREFGQDNENKYF